LAFINICAITVYPGWHSFWYYTRVEPNHFVMRNMKIAGHTVQSSTLLKGVSLGLAITAGIMGWMWKKRHSMQTRNNTNIFQGRGRRWPQAVPVK